MTTKLYEIYDLMQRLGIESPYYRLLDEAAEKAAAQIIDEKSTLERMVGKHGKTGYIIVSAYMPHNTYDENESAAKKLEREIIRSGYPYKCVYGGYHNPETDIECKYETSFYVYNYKYNDEAGKYTVGDFNDLMELGKKWCDTFGQDSIMVVKPNEPAIYIDSSGRKKNSRESKKIWKNEYNRENFTSLKPQDEVEKEIHDKLMTQYKKYRRKMVCIGMKAKTFDKWFKDKKEDEYFKLPSFVGKRWTNDINF